MLSVVASLLVLGPGPSLNSGIAVAPFEALTRDPVSLSQNAEDVAKTAANRKLAAELMARIMASTFSVVETEATGFEAVFAVTRNGTPVGRARSVWNSDAGETTTRFQGSLNEEDAGWFQNLATLGLLQSVFTEGDHDQLFAVRVVDGFLVSDYRVAGDEVKSRQLFLSEDLSQSGERLILGSGVVRTVVRTSRKDGDRHFVASARMTIETPERTGRSDDFSFAFAEKDGLPFIDSMAITDLGIDGLKTTWNLKLETVNFSRPSKPAAKVKLPSLQPAPPDSGASFKLVVKEISLGKRPAGAQDALRPAIRSDGRGVGLVVKRGEKFFVIFNGAQGPEYDEVGKEGVLFAPRGERWAYRARNGKMWMAVLDGQEGKPYAAVSDLLFSADGSRVLYGAARDRNRLSVVTDGQEGGEYARIAYPKFSPDGKRIAYAAAVSSSEKYIVLDGKTDRKYAEIGVPVFSPDGRRLAYAGSDINGEWEVVLDGRPVYLEVRGEVDPDSLRFSPDSRRLAFVMKRGDSWCVIVDDKPGKTFDRILSSVIFTPDSRRAAYSAERGNQTYVVVEGREFGPYAKAHDPVFSADGRRAVFWAKREDREFFVIDGQEGQPLEMALDPEFSPGVPRVFARVKMNGQYFLFLEGVEAGRGFDDVRGPYFSRDGRRVVYQGSRGGQWFISVDGVERLTPENIVYPAFSFDGRRFLYAVLLKGKQRMVVDGVQGPIYDEVDTPIFNAEGDYVYKAKRGDAWLVVVNGVESPDIPGAGGVYGLLRFADPCTVFAVAKRADEFIRVEIQIVR